MMQLVATSQSRRPGFEAEKGRAQVSQDVSPSKRIRVPLGSDLEMGRATLPR